MLRKTNIIPEKKQTDLFVDLQIKEQLFFIHLPAYMLLYLVKRLLWMVPTVWFIPSVVFVLSKLIPGNILYTEEAEQKSAASSRIYQQYLERTGQNLPLFYVSLQTWAEPDTLYRIFPEQNYTFAKRLLSQYGNWPAISHYMAELKQLQSNVSGLTAHAAEKKTLYKQVEDLWQISLPEQIKSRFTRLKNAIAQLPANGRLMPSLLNTENAFNTIIQTQTPYLNLIPVIRWHGTQNQYHQWAVNVCKGSLGNSYRDARPVTVIMGEALSVTLLLSLLTAFVVFLAAVLVNLFIMHEDFRHWQKPVLGFLFILDTVPVFLLALLLLLFLAANNSLNLFPVYGLGSTTDNSSWFSVISTQVYHLALPVICLSAGNLPYVTTQLYQAMQETRTADFITTARAKGVVEFRIVAIHILRNALLPIITLFSGFLPALLGGALVIEVIFAIPGMGSLLVDAILARDFPLILGIVLVVAFIKVISHIAADVLYYLADPRIRF